MGYPCPEDMELSPTALGYGKEQELSAECKCPPKTAQSASNGRCYELFRAGPCENGHYFGPDIQFNTNSTTKRQWGTCKQVTKCSNPNEIFWPQDGKCYEKYTRGPCSKGQLLTVEADNIAACQCNEEGELKKYRYENLGCYQHYTKGPCKEKGHLFLPNQTCGCHEQLPYFHENSSMCFEIDTIGPCNVGEHFQLNAWQKRAVCACRKGYIRHAKSGACYRPFTQGPCAAGDILLNETTCTRQPCERHYLYFPMMGRCYRIGTRGPCKGAQVVTFDFETRPSIDGISYNGKCACEKRATAECTSDTSGDGNKLQPYCDRDENMVLYRNKCYKLYAQGPCARGAWITPRRRKKEIFWNDESGSGARREGYCDCIPGYTKLIKTINNKLYAECLSPTVILAEYLNKNFYRISVEPN